MDKNAILKLSNAAFREEEFGGLLYNRKTMDILEVNKTGAMVVSLCNGKRTVAEIVDAISRKGSFKEKEHKILRDVLDFLDELKAKELIEEVRREGE